MRYYVTFDKESAFRDMYVCVIIPDDLYWEDNVAYECIQAHFYRKWSAFYPEKDFKDIAEKRNLKALCYIGVTEKDNQLKYELV